MKPCSALAAAVLALTACTPTPGPDAKVWNAREFIALRGQPRDFGGWYPSELMVGPDEVIPFSTARQGPGNGLTVFPGVSEGQAIGFLITMLWANHPDPWVQPVWTPVNQNGVRPADVLNIFPVGLESNFSSPYWKTVFLKDEALTPTTFRSARDVLNSKVVPTDGPLVFCPIVPDDVTVAGAAQGFPVHPLTGTPFGFRSNAAQPFARLTPAAAWVENQTVSYLPLGPSRQSYTNQTLEESPLYVFVTKLGERPLPLAAVWPPGPRGRSLLNRVDVELPPGAGAFVPANRPDLREALVARGVPTSALTDVSVALDAFPAFALRVATNPACFQDVANFPGGCRWLDSEAAVLGLREDLRRAQPVQLAAAVLDPVTP